MRIRIVPILVWLGLSILLPGLNAQDTRGQIVGRVVDPSGAVVAGASVEGRNTASNVRTVAKTNDRGDYVLPFLIPGEYEVVIQMQGFQQFARIATIEMSATVTVNASLVVGSSSESVKVVAEADPMDVSSGSAGYVVDSQTITELPNKDGNVALLSMLAPGVMNTIPSGWSRPFDVSVNLSPGVQGVAKGSNQYSLDGAPNMAGNYNAYVPPPGVVEEVKVQTATFDASYGFTPGATINMSLKSGTNSLHGQAYNFLQNPLLNANDFFSNKAGQSRGVFRLNRWGINANGPVYIPKLYNGKNKTFWMYGYEGIHSVDPRGDSTLAVPTTQERNGDFSALLKIGPQYQIYDPSTITATSGGHTNRSPFPGNIIPQSRLNATARNVANFWDLPNQPGAADDSDNWFSTGPEWDHYYNHIFRVDQNFSERNRLFVRGDATSRIQELDYHFNGADGSHLTQFNRGAAIDDVYIISPQFIVNTRYSFTRFLWLQTPMQVGMDLLGLGFSQQFVNQILQQGPSAERLPSMTVTGYGPLSTTANFNHQAFNTHDLGVNFTRIVHAHTVRFGVAYRVYQTNSVNLGASSGTFTFANNYTRGPADTSAGAPMGQTMASFLLGIPTSGSLAMNDSLADKSSNLGLYVQDDWKLSSRFTLSLGLRYEYEAPITERFNRSVEGFDAAATSPIAAQAQANYALHPTPEIAAANFLLRGGLTFEGVNGLPHNLWQSQKGNFMPRIGFAYAVAPKTVLRGGYGIFYDQLGITQQSPIQTGYSSSTTFNPTLDNGVTFIANLTNPFPSGLNQPTGSSQGLATYLGQAISFFPQKPLTPYVQRWQMGIERELPLKSTLQVSYFGSRATRLRLSKNYDALPAQYLSTSPFRDATTISYLTAAISNPFYPLLPGTSLSGTTVARSQLLEPYPQFTSISASASQGYSWYHSMQTVFQKRFAESFTSSVIWTFGKFMQATSYKNASDPLPERVISDLDHTNRVVVTGLWKLPFGRGQKWAQSISRTVDTAIGGWQFQGICQWQTGNALGFGNALLLGDISLVPLPSGQRTLSRWFNTSVFNTVSSQQLANNIQTLSTRFSGIRGDGINNADLSLFKNFRIQETKTVQFRTEFHNALNHPRFGDPNTAPTNLNFGVVTTQSNWPRVIQFALKFLF